MKYTKEILEEAVANSLSIAGVLRYLGLVQAGGTHAHVSRTIKKLGLDTSHFTGQAWSRGQKFPPRTPAQEKLVLMPPGSPRAKPPMLRNALLRTGRPYLCAICGNNGSWMLKPLILHVDHINGNYLDNRRENLRFICPNCHAQTPTYAGRNRRNAEGRAQQSELTVEESPAA